MTFNAEQFLKENPKPWRPIALFDGLPGSSLLCKDGRAIPGADLLAHIQHLEAENNRLENEAIDRKMQLRSLECVSKALEKAVSEHGDTIANTTKRLKDQILPKAEALEAENEKLKAELKANELHRQTMQSIAERLREAHCAEFEAEIERLKPLAEVGELVNRLPELLDHCNHSESIHLAYTAADGFEVFTVELREEIDDSEHLAGIFPKCETVSDALKEAVKKINGDIEEAKNFFGDDEDDE